MSVLVFLISFFASTAGAICGIGGGVIIKPALDVFQMASVSAISFLSGCTVFSMSLYSVGRGLLTRDSVVDFKTGTPLAVGAAFGGILGKQLFTEVKNAAANPDMVGGVQAGCLAIITIYTLAYTVNKVHIKTRHVQGIVPCVLIGIALGVMSSFLGIGGGPINLVVLYYFFSMSTKIAVQNSLYIILVSQFMSIATTLFTKTVPAFEWSWMILMVAGGIGGGIVGRKINSRISNKQVESLFVGLMFVVIGVSCYNTWAFMKKF
nr:sulfite exporter TauE/SafE family protein [Ruthenibacterium lactatiformans]